VTPLPFPLCHLRSGKRLNFLLFYAANKKSAFRGEASGDMYARALPPS